MVKGKRLPDGSVLSSVTFFNVSEEKQTTLDVELRKEETTVKLVGQLDSVKTAFAVDVKNEFEQLLATISGNKSRNGLQMVGFVSPP